LSFFNFQSGSSKVIINLFGRIVVALVGIVFVPVYVHLIGLESYGLVAFYGTLAGSLAILDLGLGTAISRQVAILRAQPNKEKEIKDLVFSVELIYWGIALFLGILIVILAHPIATYWVKSQDLPVPVIARAIVLMGIVFAFQFPASLYNGAMVGFERQVSNSVITIIFTIFKAVGVIAALKFIESTTQCYFVWQVVATGLFTLTLRFFVWKELAKNMAARFSGFQIRNIWRFAAGMTGISLITFFLTQIDKIVVSKMVLLEFVGYYNLAFLVSTVLQQIISPFQIVVFPRFASLITQKKHVELLALYHKSCRWIAIIVFPVGLTLIFFANEILFFWTKNPTLVTHTAPILRVFTIGAICNCMMWMPYFYLLAKGNTRYTFYQNVIASIVLVPLLFWWTYKYSAIGASFVWLSVNAGYVLISLPIFYKRFLRGELGKWLKKDVALPLTAASILVLVAKYIQMQVIPGLNIIYFIILMLLTFLIYAFIIPELRQFRQRIKFKRPA